MIIKFSSVMQNIFIAFACLLSVQGCTSFGTKVTIAGTDGEVYYKGEGVTESDAKSVGNFLKEEDYFQNDDKTKSVQISKDSGHIKARFVVNEKIIDTMQGADDGFAVIGAAMSKKVFNNTPVDIIYTTIYFKDFKTIPFNSSALSIANTEDETKQMKKKLYENNMLYYSNDIADTKADSISAYFVQSGFFEKNGNVEIIASKSNDGYLFKFPIKNSFNNPDGLQKVDNYGKEIKKNLFPSTPFMLEVIDEKMTEVKTFSY